MPKTTPEQQGMHPADIVASLRKLGLTNRKIAETLECSPTAIRLVINNTQQSKRIADYIAQLIGKKTNDIWPGVYNYKARKPYNQAKSQAAA